MDAALKYSEQVIETHFKGHFYSLLFIYLFWSLTAPGPNLHHKGENVNYHQNVSFFFQGRNHACFERHFLGS